MGVSTAQVAYRVQETQQDDGQTIVDLTVTYTTNSVISGFAAFPTWWGQILLQPESLEPVSATAFKTNGNGIVMAVAAALGILAFLYLIYSLIWGFYEGIMPANEAAQLKVFGSNDTMVATNQDLDPLRPAPASPRGFAMFPAPSSASMGGTSPPHINIYAPSSPDIAVSGVGIRGYTSSPPPPMLPETSMIPNMMMNRFAIVGETQPQAIPMPPLHVQPHGLAHTLTIANESPHIRPDIRPTSVSPPPIRGRGFSESSERSNLVTAEMGGVVTTQPLVSLGQSPVLVASPVALTPTTGLPTSGPD
ncbi:hypothetical protein HK102_008691 [Quaeritorhiza haematococci]|nr:hypothetical protein HK102_008691 [Quaeritorhiza haematococci]